MPLIEWNDALSIQISEIDNQHMKLVQIINNLHAAMLEGKGKLVIEKILNEMVDYTVYHFSTEEKLMGPHRYPLEEEHRKQHAGFVEKAKDFQEKMSQGKLFLSIEIMNFLKNWLSNHIMDSDKKFGSHLREMGLS
ncbi:MAG: hemerythrin family protein [Spirochaetales bacterium]|nr:hemerythrin family protein [Spirochaetales bacterium]